MASKWEDAVRSTAVEQAYGPVYSSQYADAIKSAKANEMGRSLGLPPDVVESDMPNMLAADRLRKRMAEVERNLPYAKMMANPRLAASSVNDDHLPVVAQRVDEHRNYVDFGKIGNPIYGTQARAVAGVGVLLGRLLSGTAQLGQGIAGLAAAGGEQTGAGSLPTPFGPVPLSVVGSGSRLLGNVFGNVSKATHYETSNRNFNDVASGFESMPASAAALGVTAFTGNPTAGAAALGAITGGQSYLTGRDEGLNPHEAAMYGLGDAVVETGTELAPERYLGRAFGFIPGAKTFIGEGLKAAGAEVGGEMLATALQGYNRWYWIDSRKGQTFKQFLDTLPDQERSTIVGTLTGFGLTIGVGKIAQKIYQPQLDARNAVGVDRIMEAAANSETRKVNPTDFREALNQLVGDSDAANIYVPVEQVQKILGDKPVNEDPFWSQYEGQINEAAALGGDVVVPLDHAATELAGTPTWEGIKDFVRTSPSGVSIAEAKQQRSPEELQQLAEQASDAISQTVRQGQLTQARQAVGQWSEQLGYTGERANVVNRMLSSALATRYNAEVSRSVAMGQAAPTLQDFAASWLPQAEKMAQAQYDSQGKTDALEQLTKQRQRDTVVNIGLAVNDGSKLTPDQALEALRSRGVQAISHEVRQSNTEPTLVARLDRPLSPEEADQVSADLHQDAIAQRVEGVGELHGPAAEKWGPFNPEYFLEPSADIELDAPPVDSDGNITLEHFSTEEGLTESDPEQWGRGRAYFTRAEQSMIDRSPPRTYFGIATGEPGGYKLEFPGRFAYTALLPKDRLYDVGRDPDGLWVRGKPWIGETAIKDAGYAGYWHKNPEIGLVAVVFEPVTLEPVDMDAPQTFNQLVNIPGFSHVEPYLTAEERENLRAQSKQKILDIVKTLPDAEEMAAVAVAGRAKKGWYASSAKALVDVFGIADAPRFAALLAALSPQTSVEMNLYNALRVWTIWNREGRPTDRQQIVQLMGEAVAGKKGSGSVLGAWINNSVTALTAEEPGQITLSGPKVNSFMNNLVGVTDEVTNDTWMANYADIQQTLFQRDNKGGKGPGYKAFNVVVRRAAQIATERTGEDWTPSEVQEAVWSFARTLYLMRDAAGETRDMAELLDAGEVTHSDIAATPDFAVLFQDGFFRTILSEGGYDVTALQSGGRAARFDEQSSVAHPEGTGFAEGAFRDFLSQAANRLERVRQRRRADRVSNESQPELVFNQAVNPAEEVFYSAAQRAVVNAPQEKASAQQWKALLTPGKTPGIKAEEVEWTGIHDWLDMQKGPVEKGVLLQVLRDRGIQVTENMLGEKLNTPQVSWSEEDQQWGVWDGQEWIGWFDSVGDAQERVEEYLRSSEPGDAQFRNWSSDPNNPTYRELLLRLPINMGGNPERSASTHWDLPSVVAHVRFMDKTDAEGKRVLFIEEVQSDWHQKGRDQGYETKPDPEIVREARAKLEKAQEAEEAARVEDDRISARAHINLRPLAKAAALQMHANLNADTDAEAKRRIAATDDEQEKMSIALAALDKQRENGAEATNMTSWGILAAQSPGTVSGSSLARMWSNLRAALDGLGMDYPDEVGKLVMEAQASDDRFKALRNERELRQRELQAAQNPKGVPEAPFKSSWPALIMKRMIRYAADGGYDKIAWTTGEEQANRYNLSQSTGPITIERAHEQILRNGQTVPGKRIADTYLVMTRNGNAMDAIRQQYGLTYSAGSVHRESSLRMTTDQVREVFGNNLGGRLIEAAESAPSYSSGASSSATLSDADLNVGGEGMKAFYDRNLVNITNDIIKKYGVKVDRVRISDGIEFVPGQRGQRIMRDKLEAAARPGFEINDKLRDAASGGFPLFQQKRGNISIIPGPDGLMKSALIRAFESSNFSTAIHELGHFFLADLQRRALSTGATDQERMDWEAFKKWAGDLGHAVTDDGAIPVDAHEYFARGFERYAWEGSAPSMGLRHLFFRLREFMIDLYKTATQFNAPITPEIREIMSRMLASDQEVEDQRQRMNLAAGTVEQLMTDEERRAYNDLSEESRQDARDALHAKVLSSLRQERRQEARNRKSEIREQVANEVVQQPVFQALNLLRVGRQQDDGSFTKIKLNRQQLIEAYGPDIEQRLPVRVMSNENTLDVDQIAAMTGFDSGDEMIKSLETHQEAQQQMRQSGDRRNVQTRMIDDMTNDRFREEVGDPLENLEEEAQAAVTNDRQADMLSMELRAIGRKTGGKVTPWKLAKEWASKRVRLQTSQEAISGRAIQMYSRNVAKAASQAEDALAKGDTTEAFAAKQRQLLNMALLQEAKKVKDLVDRAQARLKNIASRDKIQSVDQDYLEQAHQLLEDVDLKDRSQADVNRRMAFEDWYLARVAEGIEPSVPSRYRTALGLTHWSRLTIDEFLELDTAVGQIVELGRLKKKLLDGKRQRDFDEAITEAVDHAENAMAARKKSTTTDARRTLGGRVKSRLRGIDAAMIKMEQMVEWLDGRDKDGPWRRMLFNIMSDAQAREKDLTHEYVTRLNGLIKALPQEQVRALDRQVDTPELVIRNPAHSQAGEPFRGTKDQILMMAMNWGNEGNRQRLLDGYGWTEHDMISVFDRLMTKQDWDFVQGVWDLVDQLWPEIEKLERRVNGVAPEKVEATEVQTRHGMYRGGYFPIVYDPNESTQAELDDASKLSPSGAWHEISTRAGSTRSRVARVGNRPVQLNIGVITRHIGEVIHDITHREAVVQARKILRDDRVRRVVNSRLGPEYHSRMGAWLENIATPNSSNAKSDPAMTAIARHLNKGISLVGLGFRISTVLVQWLGLSNSISEIGTGRVLQGLRIMAANPRLRYNEIVERSGEMRSRFSTMDASIDDMMNEARSNKLRIIGPGAFVKYAFHGILYMDMMVTTSSWIGAYNKALDEGSSENEAVDYADSVIRKTQGAGGRKDRSAIMFANEAYRTFYPFFSYMNALYNQQRDVFHRGVRARTPGEALDVARRAWWVFAVPTLLQAMIFGQGPGDGDDGDPESWAHYLTKQVILGNLSSIPGVGALASAIGQGYGYRSNAWQGIGEDLKKSWEDIDKLTSDEDEQLKGSTVQKVIATTGILLAKPLGQAAATSRGIYDYARGNADPQTAGDWYNLLTKGNIPKRPTAIQRLVSNSEESSQ